MWLYTRTAKSGKASVNKKMDFCQLGQINFCCVLCFLKFRMCSAVKNLTWKHCWLRWISVEVVSLQSTCRHIELRLWQACALLNDWTSRDDTDFCSAWTALNVIVFLSRIVYLYVMLYWMAYTCIYLITFQKHFDTCISFFSKTCKVFPYTCNALETLQKNLLYGKNDIFN